MDSPSVALRQRIAERSYFASENGCLSGLSDVERWLVAEATEKVIDLVASQAAKPCSIRKGRAGAV